MLLAKKNGTFRPGVEQEPQLCRLWTVLAEIRTMWIFLSYVSKKFIFSWFLSCCQASNGPFSWLTWTKSAENWSTWSTLAKIWLTKVWKFGRCYHSGSQGPLSPVSQGLPKIWHSCGCSNSKFHAFSGWGLTKILNFEIICSWSNFIFQLLVLSLNVKGPCCRALSGWGLPKIWNSCSCFHLMAQSPLRVRSN